MIILQKQRQIIRVLHIHKKTGDKPGFLKDISEFFLDSIDIETFQISRVIYVLRSST